MKSSGIEKVLGLILLRSPMLRTAPPERLWGSGGESQTGRRKMRPMGVMKGFDCLGESADLPRSPC